MRIEIVAVGRLGKSAEAQLAADYVRRASASGRALALSPVAIIEAEAKKGGKRAEGEALAPHLAGAHVIACDEHGPALTSRDFAALLARLRDQGVRRLALVVGGADGLDLSVLEAASLSLAFGPQTWPHALVRVMLAEQIYRAVSILAGQPYHRD